MKAWDVEVLRDDTPKALTYTVLASTGLDARVLAFSLDGGFARSMMTMEEGHIELVKMYTKVIEREGAEG